MNECRVREQVVSVRGGTRPTPSVSGVAAAASTFKRVVVPHALSLLHAQGNVRGKRGFLFPLKNSIFNLFL